MDAERRRKEGASPLSTPQREKMIQKAWELFISDKTHMRHYLFENYLIDLAEKAFAEEIFKAIDSWLSNGDLALLADKKYLELKKRFGVK